MDKEHESLVLMMLRLSKCYDIQNVAQYKLQALAMHIAKECIASIHEDMAKAEDNRLIMRASDAIEAIENRFGLREEENHG